MIILGHILPMTDGITSDGIKALAKLPKLEELDLFCLEISDDVFKYFIELKSLELTYNENMISDAALHHIGENYMKLQYLKIACNCLFIF